jgi:hypothetical protein
VKRARSARGIAKSPAWIPIFRCQRPWNVKRRICIASQLRLAREEAWVELLDDETLLSSPTSVIQLAFWHARAPIKSIENGYTVSLASSSIDDARRAARSGVEISRGSRRKPTGDLDGRSNGFEDRRSELDASIPASFGDRATRRLRAAPCQREHRQPRFDPRAE